MEAMLAEMSQRQHYLRENIIQSLYFGGGSPSILEKEDLACFISKVKDLYQIDDDAEITLEANPDDIQPKKLQEWKKLGINRLSIGLQSFDDAELRWMNRAHTARQSVNSVRLAQEAGFENITIDLIYGSKFQTLKSWGETLQTAVGLGTQHISAYNLTIESKTALGSGYFRGLEPSVDEELSEAQFQLMVETLVKWGFEHYEISNFGKPGFIAKHNSNYWLQEHYLGIGPSAHSYDGNSRQWNLRNNTLYVKAMENGELYYEREELTDRERYNEYVLTRLRTKWGCKSDDIEKNFGADLVTHFRSRIHSQRKFIHEENGVFTLNASGKFMADGIASNLFFL